MKAKRLEIIEFGYSVHYLHFFHHLILRIE